MSRAMSWSRVRNTNDRPRRAIGEGYNVSYQLFRKNSVRFLTTVIAGGALLLPMGVLAQESTPVATPEAYAESGIVNVILNDVSGNRVGAAVFTPLENGGVGIVVQLDETDLAPGTHGIHVHQTGVCDPAGAEPFSSAGEHFNPNNSMHGAPALATPGSMPGMDEAHAGDLGNITIGDDGSGRLETESDLFTLTPDQPNSLLDVDGSAIIIHQDTDDLMTDPSGNSGPRAVCGVVFAPGQESDGSLISDASPVSDPSEATPAS